MQPETLMAIGAVGLAAVTGYIVGFIHGHRLVRRSLSDFGRALMGAGKRGR